MFITDFRFDLLHKLPQTFVCSTTVVSIAVREREKKKQLTNQIRFFPHVVHLRVSTAYVGGAAIQITHILSLSALAAVVCARSLTLSHRSDKQMLVKAGQRMRINGKRRRSREEGEEKFLVLPNTFN